MPAIFYAYSRFDAKDDALSNVKFDFRIERNNQMW